MANQGPGKIFFIGFGSVLVGGMLLLLTTGVLPTFISIWPGILLLIGTYLLYRGYAKNVSEGAVFMGFFLLLTGLLLILLNTVLSWAILERMWPLFLTVLALALLSYGLTKPGDSRAAYVIPATVMVLLSIFFLLFSLDIIQTSLVGFISRWWPLTIIILGLAVMLQNALKNRNKK